MNVEKTPRLLAVLDVIGGQIMTLKYIIFCHAKHRVYILLWMFSQLRGKHHVVPGTNHQEATEAEERKYTQNAIRKRLWTYNC